MPILIVCNIISSLLVSSCNRSKRLLTGINRGVIAVVQVQDSNSCRALACSSFENRLRSKTPARGS